MIWFMRYFILTALVLLAPELYGQKVVKQHKLLIGFSFSPDYGFRNLENGDGGTFTDLAIRSRANEVGGFGYTTGLIARINMSRFVDFETGLQYANRGYKTRTREVLYPTPSPDQPARLRTEYSYRYLTVPLLAKLVLGNKNTQFTTGVGAEAGFFLQAKSTAVSYFDDGRKDRNTSTSPDRDFNTNISGIFNFGVSHRLSRHLQLTVEPCFRYGFNKIKDAPVEERLWSGGLAVGILYRVI